MSDARDTFNRLNDHLEKRRQILDAEIRRIVEDDDAVAVAFHEFYEQLRDSAGSYLCHYDTATTQRGDARDIVDVVCELSGRLDAIYERYAGKVYVRSTMEPDR